MANKVQFGLKNVHYALLTETEDEAPTWGTPKKLAGAVNIELSQESSVNNFYADNVEYFRVSANNGYTGSLELAIISDDAKKDIWGFNIETTSKVLSEDTNAEPKPFALLFQIDGDANDDYYVFYKCFAERPNITSATIDENGKEPQTQTVDLTCVPLVDPSTQGTLDGKIYAKTTAETSDTIRNAWFTSVYAFA